MKIYLLEWYPFKILSRDIGLSHIIESKNGKLSEYIDGKVFRTYKNWDELKSVYFNINDKRINPRLYFDKNTLLTELDMI